MSRLIVLAVILTSLLAMDCVAPESQDAQQSVYAGDVYFPPPEREGGWRTNTDPEFVRSLGLDPEALATASLAGIFEKPLNSEQLLAKIRALLAV